MIIAATASPTVNDIIVENSTKIKSSCIDRNVIRELSEAIKINEKIDASTDRLNTIKLPRSVKNFTLSSFLLFIEIQNLFNV